VFPKIPGYFIVSAIYMISEKAADVIIEDAKKTTARQPQPQAPARVS
jgi:choline dehydrogenase